MKDYLVELLKPLNFSPSIEKYLIYGILSLVLIIIVVISYVLIRKLFVEIAIKLSLKSKNHWDDILLKNSFFHKLSHLIPASIFYFSIPLIFEGEWVYQRGVSVFFDIYFTVVLVRIINAFLNSVNDIHESHSKEKHKSIKSYIQLAKIVVYILAGMTIFSSITGHSIVKIILSLGAFAAIIILIFQDTIKGLVSGVHLSANDMIRIGDWVSVPKYGADGNVIEITLVTVKVQNWDKTISMVPTYALVSDSFSNWRGMENSGGRRIKRSIYIDLNCVRFLTDEDRKRLSEIELLKDYLELKDKEVAKASEVDFKMPSTINHSHLTNIGTFRKYLELYLKNNSNVNQEMTCMVRQLQSTEKGLPMEIYCFSKVKSWVEYEIIQADIFDHIFASAEQFGINIYQNPTGSDFKSLTK